MIAFFAMVAVAAYWTITIDHPFFIASSSRGLYVDEGFYTDAAQNFTKFGQWGFPYDFPHWAGAPFLTAVQSLIFPVFGPGLETARMISVVFSIVSAFAFYALARMGMRPVAAMVLTVSAVLTFNYVAFSRTAFADPVAACFGLLALLAFSRVRARSLAIPISMALAFLAFFTKLYYLFTLITVATLWIVELVLVPVYKNRTVDKRSLLLLGLSVAVITVFFGFFLARFGERLHSFYAINAYLAPDLEIEYLGYLWDKFLASIRSLRIDTKSQVYVLVLPAVVVALCVLVWFRKQRVVLQSGIAQLTRADYAVCLWVLAGLPAVSLIQTFKPHYHYFAILPAAFVAATALKLIVPSRYLTGAICIVAAFHLWYQSPYYYAWAERSGKTDVYDASRTATQLILAEHENENRIVLIGEYAAQQSLFDERFFSLDARWHPGYPLCEEVSHWKPQFHINVVWPGSRSQEEKHWIESCKEVAGTEEVARFHMIRQDELVLNRINYVE